MRHKEIILAVILLFFPISSYAADITVTMTVDKSSASIDDTIVVDVSVEGKRSAERPEIHGFENFDVRYGGTSSQFKIINGSMSSSKVFQYVLYPKKAGRFVIGPAVVRIKGNEYKSQKVELYIQDIQDEKFEAPQEKSAYLSARVSDKKPFVGEQILYTVQFNTRIPVQNAHMALPDFKNFWKEQLGGVRNYEKVMNGRMWQVGELKIAIFPSVSGRLEIERAGVTADVVSVSSRRRSLFDHPFFGFSDTERKIFKSSPITLDVKPLPEDGRPSNFSGLVGSFSISAGIGSAKLEVGESSTLTIKLRGNGGLRNYPVPKLVSKSRFKVYDDEPSLEVTPLAKGVRETKIFKKAIVPLSPGKLTLPPIELNYFDPAKEQYVSVSTDPIVIEVRPSSHPEKMVMSSGEGVGIAKEELKVLGDDLMPLFKNTSALKSDSVTVRMTVAYIMLSILPMILFLAAFYWRHRMEKVRSDSGYLRRGRAGKYAQKEMRKLAGIHGNDFCSRASEILRDYIGNKLNIDGRSLTAVDVGRRLEPFGADDQICRRIVEYLNKCDTGIYGGKSFDEKQHASLVDELKHLIKVLEKEIKA